jgi:hypothetical protein
VDVAVNDLSSQNIFKEILRGFMSRKLPQNMRGTIPFYGDVIIYVLRKPLGTNPLEPSSATGRYRKKSAGVE